MDVKFVVKNTEKFIYYFIIALPIIDIFTALTVNFPLSTGAIIRTSIMFILMLFIIKQSFLFHKSYLVLFFISTSSITITIICNYLFKEPFYLFSEIQFYLKTMYFIVMIFTVLILLSKKIVSYGILQATEWAAIILGISYWIAILTNTNLQSYAYDKHGFSGWFFSANELSVIVLILLSLVICQFHQNKSIRSLLANILLLSMTPMIGTKTAFYGGFIIFFTYIIFLLFKEKIQKQTVTLISVALLYILLLPMTPVAINESFNFTFIENISQSKENGSINELLSSRDIYLEDTKNDYINAIFIRKLFGLGYAGDYEVSPKTIEMDLYDLFFSYGIIGTISLLIPVMIIAYQLIKFNTSITYILLFLTCGLCAGVSFVAGHVIFAPSVMTYMAILFIATYLATEEGISNNNEKRFSHDNRAYF